jgi:hypothetical protein
MVFSKTNILIPTVAEKNIQILLEEKKKIWFRVFVIPPPFKLIDRSLSDGRKQRQPNHNTFTYCVYWRITINQIIIRPHNVFTYEQQQRQPNHNTTKNIQIFVEEKKKNSDSEFLSYNLMLNSRTKFCALGNKRNKYSNYCVVRKKNSEWNKKPQS